MPALVAAIGGLLAATLDPGVAIDAGPAAAVSKGLGDELAAAGTPVGIAAEPTDPVASDPLDGEPSRDDPLDGDPRREDSGAPPDISRLEIVRSGRPNEEPLSLPAYDDDPTTVWIPAPESEGTWLWLDLGGDRRLVAVRWLAQGSGAVGVAVSRDLETWRDVDGAGVSSLWQGIELSDDARYVRLELTPDDDGNLPGLAEIAVYGADRTAVNAAALEADGSDPGRIRNRIADDNAAGRNPQPVDTSPSGNVLEKRQRGARTDGNVRISTKPGETRCTGKRERCQAREGRVSVAEDCGRDGSCNIDVRADGGTAICDASGPDRATAGNGEGRRGGDGGECEAVANGGSVTIGAVEP